MKQRGIFVAALVVAAGAAFVALGASTSSAESAPAVQDAARTVEVEVAQMRSHSRQALFHGLTKPSDHTVLAFTVPGRMQARPVEVGSRVKRGDLIARLDAKPLRNARDAAKAQLAEVEARAAQLRREQERARGLLEAGAATEQQVEQANTGANAVDASKFAADVNVRETKRQLGETVLRAPFDGEVTAILAEADQVVGAGTPVVQLTGRDRVEVELQVPLWVASALDVDAEVEVESPGFDLQLRGTVVRVGSHTAGVGHLFPVVVDVSTAAGTEVPSGLPVEVRFSVGRAEKVAVPLHALLDPSGARPYVFVVEDDVVRRAFVTPAGFSGGDVLLAEGLEPGASVVVQGFSHLLEGDPVVVR
jgi:RND family efflux transporter MFP subunit